MAVAVDFETYYDKEYSIKIQGVDGYIYDQRFDAYLVAIVGEGIEYVGHPKDFDWTRLNGKLLVAHNARFDETVSIRLQELGRICKFTPTEWRCTADLSVYMSAPRHLAGAAEQLLGVTMDKSTRAKMKGLTYAEACELGMKEEVHAYTLDDSRPCLQIWEKFSPLWPENEQRLSRLNRIQGRRGVFIDRKLLDEGIEKLKLVQWEAEKNIPWDWSKNLTPLSPKKLRAQCREAGIYAPGSLAQTSVECIKWEEKYGDVYPWVGAMRNWRRSNILLKKLQTLERRIRPDGTFPFSLKYFGGHTGRWSGDGGFNMQNMPRGELFGVDLRAMFIPRPGYKFVISDFAQIEARITLWLVGDLDMIAQVEAGHNVYEAHAIATMGWPSDKTLKKEDPALYQLAKARVLGLGFGCGHKRFRALAEEQYGIVLTAAEAKKAVDDFRRSNPKITAYWRRLQDGLARSVKDRLFEIELPSGRDLSYFSVTSTDGYTAELVRGSRRTHMYGGLLTENAVQATARDAFAEGMLRLVDAGYPPLFHVHDEYVLEVPEEDLKDVKFLTNIEQIITQQPEWLPGCPMGAETVVTEKYLK